MTTNEKGYLYHRLRSQVSVLRDVLEEYPTASVCNAIKQIESRIKELEKDD